MPRYEKPNACYSQSPTYFNPDSMRRREVISDIDRLVIAPLLFKSNAGLTRNFHSPDTLIRLEAYDLLATQLVQSIPFNHFDPINPRPLPTAVIDIDPLIADEVIEALVPESFRIAFSDEGQNLDRKILPTGSEYVTIEESHNAKEGTVTRLLVYAAV